jgi:flavin-binding protein dodecin
MSVGRVTEITAESATSFEDAIKVGIARATSTLRGVQSAWIQEQQVSIQDDGSIRGYRVTMKIVFMLEG